MFPEAQAALDKAKVALMAKPDSAFFTTLCFSLKHLWDERIPTACTNGREIRYQPKFFLSLSPEERVFLLVHETMHVALLHMDRLNTRKPAKWNVAADHVINLMLLERGFRMPKGGLADPQYKDLSTDEVYALLPEPDPSKVEMDLEPGEGDPEELKKDIEDLLVQAAIQSKLNEDKPGTIPGEVQIFLNGLLNPQLPWNRILQKYVNALAKNDYSFRKPNRRLFPEFLLPSLYSRRLNNIAIAVDVSGSVTDGMFKSFITEIVSIFKMMAPEKISVLHFDTQIRSVDEVRSLRDIQHIHFTGRGGTRIGPVLEWAIEKKPQLLLVFTDGEFNFPEMKPRSPFLWVIHGDMKFEPPFGKTIRYTIKE